MVKMSVSGLKKRNFIIAGILLYPIMLAASIVDTPVARLSAAQQAWLLDRRAEALSLYLQELDTTSHPQVVAYNIAYLYYNGADFQNTDRYLNRALELDPKYGPALMLKGMIEYDRKNLRNAYTSLRQAIRHHTLPEIPNYQLGKMLYKRGKYGEAAEFLEDAIKRDKLFTFSYALLGDIYIRQKKYDKASDVLEKGLKYSYDAEIVYNLARAYGAQGDADAAIRYYGLFCYLFPKHPDYATAREFLDRHEVNHLYTHGFAPLPERTAADRFFPVGEDIVYSVYWGPIRVGELNTAVLEALSYNGQDAYKVRFSLDSNPALAFIASLHSDYITIIDRDTKQTLRHFLHIRENNIIGEKVYDYLRDEGIFKCRMIREDGHIYDIEKYLPLNTIDGTSILFYSRQVVKEKRSERVMTTIDEGFVITDIKYENKMEPVLVRGEHEEQAYLITGVNKYKGIVGFTGRFRGWFRDDPTYLPLASDFEIWVGRIDIHTATLEEQRLHKYAR